MAITNNKEEISNEEFKNEEEKIQLPPDDNGLNESPPEDTEFLDILDEIKYYYKIPEGCFEKVLTKVCYALYFKTN